MVPRLLRCAIEKVADWHAQARGNPFGWEAYVVVCAFSADGHRIRFTRHPFEEA